MKKKLLSIVLSVCLILALTPQMAFAASEMEDNNTFDTAQSISVNEFVSGSLLTSNDADYYAIDVESDGYLSVTFNHEYVENSGTYWKVALYNLDNEKLVTYSFAGNKTKNDCNPIGIPAGIYYVKITANSDYYHSSVPYEMMLNYTQSNEWETEFNDSFATADQIYANVSVNGNLMHSNDADYYKIDLPDTGYLNVTFNHEYIENSGIYWKATIYNLDNEKLVTYSFAGNKTKNDCNPIGIPAGIYYVKITANTDYYHSSVPYEMMINYTQSDEWETEFNDSFATTDQIYADIPVSGSLMHSRDADYYKINLNSTGDFRLSFNHEHVENSGTYWKATIYNSDNEELVKYSFAGNKTETVSEEISMAVGTYYVKITANSDYYYSGVKYTLSLSSGTQSVPDYEPEPDTNYEPEPDYEL